MVSMRAAIDKPNGAVWRLPIEYFDWLRFLIGMFACGNGSIV
jgi:hypothetical protein